MLQILDRTQATSFRRKFLSQTSPATTLATPPSWTPIWRKCFVFIARKSGGTSSLEEGKKASQRVEELRDAFIRDINVTLPVYDIPTVDDIMNDHDLLSSAPISTASTVLLNWPSSRNIFEGSLRTLIVYMSEYSPVELVLVEYGLGGITTDLEHSLLNQPLSRFDLQLKYAFALDPTCLPTDLTDLPPSSY